MRPLPILKRFAELAVYDDERIANFGASLSLEYRRDFGDLRGILQNDLEYNVMGS